MGVATIISFDYSHRLVDQKKNFHFYSVIWTMEFFYVVFVQTLHAVFVHFHTSGS